ncbi:MAG: dTDP-4-dehydrorhamnose 3,5-epimerase [Chloroflexota bacterium]
MPFHFTHTAIPEVVVIEPRTFPDARGFFLETYKRSEFAAHGITGNFVQCNQSHSLQGTVRGLHYQKQPRVQCKLVWTVSGEIYDVVVDLRRDGPTYGKWVGLTLSAENKKLLYVPAGFAHGFCVTSDDAQVIYLTTEEYAPDHEAGVIWNDPDLAIRWPIVEPKLSPRDRSWPTLKLADNNFRYQGPTYADNL